MEQQPGALDVAQEIVTQAGALGGPGDQAGDVGEHGAIAAGAAHHPQIGHQGGEGVVGDLGPGRRKHGNQRALAGIGQTDDAHLGKQLELQLHQPLLAVLALGALLRRPVAVAEVVGIAQAAAAAHRHQQLIAGGGEIAEQDAGAGIAHLGAAGHLDQQVLAAGAGAAVGAAAAAIVGGEQPPVLEVEQGLQVGVGSQQHVAAAAAVAAGGAAGRHIFLAAEGHDAVAAAAGLHRDAGLIDELHCCKLRIAPNAGPEAAKEIG